MRIAIFSAFTNSETINTIKEIITISEKLNHEIIIIESLKKDLESIKHNCKFFKKNEISNFNLDFLFSVGGDGTLLRSITIVKNTEIPILGINTGNLGFLTSLQKEYLKNGLKLFFDKKYTLVNRSLLNVKTKNKIDSLNEFNYALNEVSINRKDTTSMLSIETSINDQSLTTYWADGLIISTPTGSTGYSLSSGGPILSPNTKTWVLNPIAPHNINVRPLIISDSSNIKISVKGKGENFLLSLDSRIFTLKNGNEIFLKKASFNVKTVELKGDFFFKTLREKLFWGKDQRNTQ
jgi:NAD+ kinase